MNLIDRDVLIEKIRDDGILGNGYSDSEREDDVIDRIESCQTVDAAPVVHGEWTETGECYEDTRCIYQYWVCSACGNEISGRYGLHNYCPNCGAKMDKNKEEEK